MPEVRERKWSIFSARPLGLKIAQWCFATRGPKRASVVIRWAWALERRVPVVVVAGAEAAWPLGCFLVGLVSVPVTSDG